MNLDELLGWAEGIEANDVGFALAGLGAIGEWVLRHPEDIRLPPDKIFNLAVRPSYEPPYSPAVLACRFNKLDWQEISQQAAKSVAPAWQEFTDSLPRPWRLELHGILSAETLVIGELLKPERRTYLRADRPRRPISWRWPLRFGFASDGLSREMRDDCDKSLRQRHPWAAKLASTLRLSPIEPECDIACIPFAALSRWLKDIRPGMIEADVCLLLLEDGPVDSTEMLRAVKALRAKVHPSAIAWQQVWKPGPGEYLAELVRGISHALPFDGAFTEASWQLHFPPGFMISSARFLRASGLAGRLQNQKHILKDADLHMDIPSGSPLTYLGVGPGLRHVSDVVKVIPPVASSEMYYRESRMATTMIDMEASAIAAEDTTARQINVRVDLPGGEVAVCFVRDLKHTIHVCLANLISGWLSSARKSEFPGDVLPWDLDEHELQVALTILHPPFQSMSRTIVLPRRGRSSTATFSFEAPADCDDLAVRILIAFRNRVLQTAVLRGSTVDHVAQSPKQALTLETESVTFNQFDALHERSWFGSTLVLNKSPDGQSGITFLRDGGVSFDRDDDIDKIRNELGRLVGQAAYDVESYATIDTPASQRLLWQLAVYGVELRRLIDRLAKSPVSADSRIQVLCVDPKHKLPVEYCYDDDVIPIRNAPVCEHAREALIRGECSSDCPSHSDRNKVVCPLKFWAANRVIERHVFDPDNPQSMGDEEWSRTKIGARARDAIDPLACVLSGMSVRVSQYDAQLPGQIGALLESITTAHFANDWDLWRSALKHRPSTLLAIGHVEMDKELRLIPRMEIGDASWLLGIESNSCVRLDGAAKPLVMLLGCEAASAVVELFGFLRGLFRGGAGVVLTTSSSIHAKHAVELAMHFFKELMHATSQFGDAPLTFGEVLRDVRRRMLAVSSPMPLCAVLFGDADWRLLKSTDDKSPVGRSAGVPSDDPSGPKPKVPVHIIHTETVTAGAEEEKEKAEQKQPLVQHQTE